MRLNVQKSNNHLYIYVCIGLTDGKLVRGVQKLTGENLKVVWPELSTLS